MFEARREKPEDAPELSGHGELSKKVRHGREQAAAPAAAAGRVSG